MNELPPSSGAEGNISRSPVTAPEREEPVPETAKRSDWQGKGVAIASDVKPQPLDEPESLASVQSQNVSVAEPAYFDSPDPLIKSKSALGDFFDKPDPLSKEEVSAHLYSIKFPELPRHQGNFGEVLKKLEYRFSQSKGNRQAQAHCMFHKALILRRMGQSNDLIQLALNLALKYDPKVVSQQVKTAVALTTISMRPDAYLETLDSMSQITKAQKSAHLSIMAHLNKYQCKMGFIDSGLLQIFQNPSFVPLFLGAFCNTISDPSSYLPEATFCNSLELSFILERDVYHLDDLDDDKLGAANLIWILAISSLKDYANLQPKSFSRDLSRKRMAQITPIFLAQSFTSKEVIDDLWAPEHWEIIKGSLKMLSGVKLKPPITYGKAAIAMLLGMSAELGILDISRKACADYFNCAGEHPVFFEMLVNAAHHYQRTMLYSQAADALNKYLKRPYIPLERRLAIAEALEECQLHSAQHEEFLAQQAIIPKTEELEKTPPLAEPDSELLHHQAGLPSARRRKKGGKGGKGKAGKQQKMSGQQKHKNSESLKEQHKEQHKEAVAQVQEVKPEESKATEVLEGAAIGSTGVEVIDSAWGREACAKMNSFYDAKKNAQLKQENQAIESCVDLVKSPEEQFVVHYQAAWHYLDQIQFQRKYRTNMPDGKPATVDYLSKVGRTHLASCFKSITGKSIGSSVDPDTVRAHLQAFKVPEDKTSDEIELIHKRLRMLMSSFGHSYNYQAELQDANPDYGVLCREFYKLKSVADPDYSKTKSRQQEQYQGVDLVDRETFEILRKAFD